MPKTNSHSHSQKVRSAGSAVTLVAAICFSALAPANAAGESWRADCARAAAAESNQDPAGAENYYRQALSKMESEAHKPADQENCLRHLADAVMLRGKTSEAQGLYQKLLDMISRRYGARSPKTADILMILGSIQESQGDHGAAMGLYQRALNLNEKSFGPYSPEFAGNLHKLGRASFKAGRPAEAQKHYKRAINILTQDPALQASGELKSLLKDYSDLIKTDDNSDQALINDYNKDLGLKPPINTSTPKPTPPETNDSAWQKQNSFSLRAQSQENLNEDPLVSLRGISRPTTEKNLAPVFKTMSDTIFKESHFEKGEDYYKRKIATDIQALGSEHPSVANDMCGLAVLYISRQNYAQARPLLLRALPIYEKAWGNNNILTINTRTSLASVEFHLGNIESATRLYREALSQGQSSLGPNSLETARILNDLAYLNYHQGKLQESCTFYEWALASTEGAVGQKDPLLAACLKDYAQVLRGLGRNSEATAVETRAETILTKVQ